MYSSDLALAIPVYMLGDIMLPDGDIYVTKHGKC